MMMALLPAGAASAQTAEARTTNPPCDGNYDSTFDDIEGSAHEGNVLCMADLNLTFGTNASNGESYAPRNVVTRGQMASFVVRFIEEYTNEDLDEGDTDRFDDFESDFEHAENINKLANIDVVRGTNASGGDSYAPQSGVTRAQMGSFIRLSLSWIDDGDARNRVGDEDMPSAPPATDDDFFDDDDGSVHEDNINALADVGIVEGFDDGNYRPGNNVFRDQMASFVMRAFNYAIVEELGDDPVVDPGRTEDFDVELSWFDEVSTTGGEAFGADDLFATGDAGPAGENGADGFAELTVDEDDNTITFDVEYSEVEGGFGDGPGLHIHEGDRDENGPVVVLLATGGELNANAEDGRITATVDAGDFDVSEILDAPEDYYVNLHSSDFPGGAIRGQLPDGPPSIETATSTWNLTATPDEVPAGGEPGAEATFNLTFDSVNNVVCYEIDTDGVTGGYQSPAHTSTHIHDGDVGVVGPPVVLFRNPTPVDNPVPVDSDQRSSDGCHSIPQETNTGDPDNGVGFDLAEIEANPTEYYVDIHTEDFAAGAVRAQFELPQTEIDGLVNATVTPLAGSAQSDQVVISFTGNVTFTAGPGPQAQQFELNGETGNSLGAGGFNTPDRVRVTFSSDTLQDGDNTLIYTETEGNAIIDEDGEPVRSPDQLTFQFTP